MPRVCDVCYKQSLPEIAADEKLNEVEIWFCPYCEIDRLKYSNARLKSNSSAHLEEGQKYMKPMDKLTEENATLRKELETANREWSELFNDKLDDLTHADEVICDLEEMLEVMEYEQADLTTAYMVGYEKGKDMSRTRIKELEKHAKV